MKINHAASELQSDFRKCLAIGVFDGVHLGHQQVIRQAIADARQHEGQSIVVTFDCHPSSIVAPERAPALIYPLAKKLRVIEELGVDSALVLHFDENLSRIEPDVFIRQIACELKNIQSICVGSSFTFGHQRRGNVELLRALGKELGYIVHGLSAVSLDGERVSSTRIRAAISGGLLDEASQMLGRSYGIVGPVVAGDQLGRRLGFPTANVGASGLALPPRGVYAAHVLVVGKQYRAAVNIGVRPTIGSELGQTRVEAHLLEFAGDLYGQEVEVMLIAKLRDEMRFDSPEELKNQIRKDILEANRTF